MEVSDKTIGSATSSRFARLSVKKDTGGQEVVVCKKSFFSWAVHAIRYRFSSNYREREHALRTSILVGLRGRGSNTAATLDDLGDAPNGDLFGNRREFNAYLINHLGKSDSPENSTAGSQGEIRAAEDGATSGNSQVQPASAVKAKKIASSKQKWPGAEGVESFWNEQGPAIAKDGYENVFRVERGKCPVEDEKLLCVKVSDEIAKTINKGVVGTVQSHVNCALGYVLFTTPEGEQGGLFTDSDPIDRKNPAAWGLSDSKTGNLSSHCRLPNLKLYGAVNGLLNRHFQAGQSKKQILKGLRQERKKVGDPANRQLFKPWGVQGGQPISEAEFRFCVDAMEKFANAYFDANS